MRFASGAYEEAEQLYRRSLASWETLLGPDHPNVAIALNNLAALQHTLGTTPTLCPRTSVRSASSSARWARTISGWRWRWPISGTCSTRWESRRARWNGTSERCPSGSRNSAPRPIARPMRGHRRAHSTSAPCRSGRRCCRQDALRSRIHMSRSRDSCWRRGSRSKPCVRPSSPSSSGSRPARTIASSARRVSCSRTRWQIGRPLPRALELARAAREAYAEDAPKNAALEDIGAWLRERQDLPTKSANERSE